MARTYIAAYDGTEAAHAAVELAAELARAELAEVVVAHVYPPFTTMPGRASLPAADQELRAEARRAGEQLLDGLDVPGIAERVLVAGSPAHALHDLAVERGASLLAVGVTHHGHVGRLIPGSVGAKLLHGAPCPVVAVPAGTATGPIRTIAVAFDDGPEARAALTHAVGLASALGAELVLLGAYELPLYAGPALATAWDVSPELRDAFGAELAQAAGRVDGVAVSTRVIDGPAGPSVADATEEGIDLLVTGSRGYGPVRSVLLGGVSRHLVDHAHCPVLVVPR